VAAKQMAPQSDKPKRRERTIFARVAVVTAGLSALALLVLVFCCGFGDRITWPWRTYELLSNALSMTLRDHGREITDPQQFILWNLRLPRVILGALVGWSLATAGASLQGLLRNPLADPYIIGVSAGSAVGATLCMLLHLDAFAMGFGVPILAFAGALATMSLVYAISRVDTRVPVETFLLAGVVVGSFMWALVTFMMTLAGTELSRVVFWLMGSLQGRGWGPVAVVFPIAIIGFVASFALARDFNAFAIGEDAAAHLGVRTESFKRWVIAIASLMTAAAVSWSGIIGFVGFIVPHIARRLFGADHRILFPSSALSGAILLMAADALARTLFSPNEIPVGVITALAGAPFFLYLLRQRRVQR